jgi:hypothetical protein
MEAMLVIIIALLISTSKNAMYFLYCLCLLFNKIGEKGRIGSEGGGGGRGNRSSNATMSRRLITILGNSLIKLITSHSLFKCSLS